MKELFELRRFLLILNLCLITAFSIAAPIVSGDYDGMLIGVDNEGALTGYFESSTGNGQFSCIFFVNGKSGSSPITHVDSWFPTDLSPRDVIPGTIESLAEKGQGAIRVKLKEEHGGCWNVQHFASEPAVFGLTEKGSWQAIRVVSAKRAYFHDDSSGTRPRKAYVVQGNVLRVFESQSGWARVEYESPERKRTRGWVSERDLYSARSR